MSICKNYLLFVSGPNLCVFNNGIMVSALSL
jgi:hypothetical protein